MWPLSWDTKSDTIPTSLRSTILVCTLASTFKSPEMSGPAAPGRQLSDLRRENVTTRISLSRNTLQSDIVRSVTERFLASQAPGRRDMCRQTDTGRSFLPQLKRKYLDDF